MNIIIISLGGNSIDIIILLYDVDIMDIILRLLGGDNINDILVILLDDLERTFESEEEALASMVLKVRLIRKLIN